MANDDRIEWRLLDTNLTTQLCILPVDKGHIYFEFNEPGSGEISIPLDSNAAALIEIGQFAECFYRGSSRGGFFVDNLKEIHAYPSEGGGRWLSASGKGPLILLDNIIIWSDGTTDTNRAFTAQ